MNNLINAVWHQDGMIKVDNLFGSAFTAEDGGHTFQIRGVDESGQTLSMAGSISATFIRPDGTTVALTGSNPDGVATITLTDDCYAVPGYFSMFIYMTLSGQITCVYACVGNIVSSSTGSVAPTASVDVVDLINAIEEAVASIPADYSALWTSLAPEYSSSATYRAGDFVTYSGKLYQCMQDITTAEAWTSGHWNETPMGYSVSSNMIIMNSVFNGGTAKDGQGVVPMVAGYYKTSNDTTQNGQYTRSNVWSCCRCECSAGDVFTVNLHGTTGSTRAWAFYNSSNVLVSRAGSNVDVDGQVTAPEGSAYAVFNNRIPDLPDGYVFKGIPVVYDGFPMSGSSVPVKSGGLYDEMQEIRDAIGEAETEEASTRQDDYYWNDETDTAVKTAYEDYGAYTPIEVEPGERYRVYGYYGTSEKQHLALVVDENYKILYRGGTTRGSFDNAYFTVPDGGKYILMTARGTARCYRRTLYHTTTDSGQFDFFGKNVAILGDSISTNGDWSAGNPLGNVPEIVVQDADVGVSLSAYVTLYDVYSVVNSGGTYSFEATGKTIGGHTFTEAEIGTEVTVTPAAGDVGKTIGVPKNNNAASLKTWWEVAQEVLQFNAIPACWSGASVTDHEENVKETAGGTASSSGKYVYKCSHAFHPSQIRKCGIRTPGSMERTAPDMVIIYRGTNDFSHSPYTRLTDYLETNPISIPATDAYDDGGTTRYGYLEGLAITIDRLRQAYPETIIVLCTFNYFHRNSTNYPGFPSRNGVNTIYQYNDAIRRMADFFGCGLIEFDKDGITYANAASGAYYNEGTSESANHTHPNAKGQKVLGNRALIDLQNINSKT